MEGEEVGGRERSGRIQDGKTRTPPKDVGIPSQIIVDYMIWLSRRRKNILPSRFCQLRSGTCSQASKVSMGAQALSTLLAFCRVRCQGFWHLGPRDTHVGGYLAFNLPRLRPKKRLTCAQIDLNIPLCGKNKHLGSTLRGHGGDLGPGGIREGHGGMPGNISSCRKTTM